MTNTSEKKTGPRARAIATMGQIIPFCALFLIALPLKAQPVSPGRVTPGEKVYDYERVVGDNAEIFATVYERISIDPEGGIIHIVYTQELPGMTMTDSIAVDADTFFPLKYRSWIPERQDIRVSYVIPGETEVHLQRSIPGMEVDTLMTVETRSGVYDLHWPHLVLYALQHEELAAGDVELPVFTYRDHNAVQKFRYHGEESVTLHGSVYTCWAWETHSSTSGSDQYYWIDTETNRLLQYRAEMPNGMVFWIRLKEM